MNAEALFAAREKAIEHYYATTPLNRQLDDFFEDSERGDRRWLRSPDLDVYVRHNRRNYGKVIAQLLIVSSYQSIPIRDTVECLDIADVEFKDDKNFAKWEAFLRHAYKTNPWGAIYLDEVGHGDLQTWCKGNRLNRVIKGGAPDRSDNSFYLTLPPRKNTIIAASISNASKALNPFGKTL